MAAVDSPEVVDRLAGFYRTYHEERLAEFLESYDPNAENVFHVDYKQLRRFDAELAQDYLAQPDRVQTWLEEGLAMGDWPLTVDLERVTVSVENLPDTAVHYIGEYDIEAIEDTYAGLRGQVSKRTQPQLRITEAAFECQRCGTMTRVPQYDDRKLQEPHTCQGCDRNGPFLVDTSECSKVPYQRLRLQVPPEKATGDTPTVDATLEGNLVDTAKPGDSVILNGVIETEIDRKGKEKRPLLNLSVDGRSVETVESDFEDIEITPHLDRIREIANSSNPLEQIVDSIAPSIKGYDELKEAIAYQMFGGVEKELPDGSQKRGSLHILFVSDPGCGKSTLLRYTKRLSPRAVYTSGKQSTAAGLTGAAVQDDFGDGGWTIEAGALVEAHKGLAAIDEFDKMDEEDQSGVMQAMSEQEISLSKAGLNPTLPAKTTILAAANPRDGRFDPYEPTATQVDLDPALFSRFDLVFTMADTPDEQQDREISQHMNHVQKIGQQIEHDDFTPDLEDEEVNPEIEPEVMRAYIAHARDIVPVLTDEAAERIEDEYVKLRTANDDDGPIPTTARMNDALVRLAEASARIRLDDRIMVEDAEAAIAIHRRCLEDVGVDPETGEFDVDAKETGKTKSQRERIQSVQNIISRLEDEYEKGAPHDAVIETAEEEGFRSSKIEHELEKLRGKGEIYESCEGHYRSV